MRLAPAQWHHARPLPASPSCCSARCRPNRTTSSSTGSTLVTSVTPPTSWARPGSGLGVGGQGGDRRWDTRSLMVCPLRRDGGLVVTTDPSRQTRQKAVPRHPGKVSRASPGRQPGCHGWRLSRDPCRPLPAREVPRPRTRLAQTGELMSQERAAPIIQYDRVLIVLAKEDRAMVALQGSRSKSI